ncbi:hypothetical protein ACUXD4_001129 [Staphylococcus lugdunensis]|nr:hypothetical protein T979_00488 [Staphylococcus lugdunensis UCIM6116]SQI87920.1 Uncharacterised protein [Staphylococcus lugdunensis]
MNQTEYQIKSDNITSISEETNSVSKLNID